MSDPYELRCRECGKTWGNAPRSFCEDCFSPVEVTYDYDSLKKTTRRENLSRRSFNMWRYPQLLPPPQGFQPPNPLRATPRVASQHLSTRMYHTNPHVKH